MRRSSATLAASILIPIASANTLAQSTLVWSDEFDGTSLNPANWEPLFGNGTLYGLPAGWGNNELQNYTNDPSNLSVSGGALHIVARHISGSNYSSARIRSKNLQDFLYGRFEARIKLPSGQGIWPAFWMLPTDSPYGIWAASGEIDIVESVNTADTIYGTIHYGGQWPDQQKSGNTFAPGTDFSQDFHVYAVEWEPDAIRWYVDGVLYHSRISAQWFSEIAPANPRAPFDVPFHLLLNVAVGGDFPGNPNAGVGFPMEMTVDYVRVYQNAPVSQEPFLGTPHPIPGTIEAEDFDIGGQTIAYSDEEPTNLGGAARTDEGVDLEPCSEGGFNVGWIRPGEWIEYSVDVQTAGEYRIDARVASDSTGGIFHLELTADADPIISPTFVAPVTNGWQTWTTASVNATLDAGPHILRFVNDGSAASEYNVNRFEFTLLTPPPSCVGDLDGDNDTDVFDFNIFAPAFGSTGLTPFTGGDLDGDGDVDVFDFNLFAPDFGCTP